MVQVLPETSNSNIWQQAARDASVGYFEGKKIADSREKERQKKALFAAATDENLTPMDRTKAMTRYIGEHGEVGDIIKYQKEQNRLKYSNEVMDLLNGRNTNQNPEGNGQNTGTDLANIGNQPPANNAPPVGNPPQNDQQIQNAQDLFNGKPKVSPEAINTALFNLAQYDPPGAKVISDALGRKQKDEIAQKNQDLKERKLDQDAEQFRVNKIIPIQEHAMETIKSTNTVLKATNDQLAAVQADTTGIWSMANLSKLLRDAGHETLADAVQSEGGAAMVTAGKEIFTGGFKRAFGSKPIGIEFNAFEAMLAQVGRKKEVNEMVIKSIQAEYQIANEVAKYQMQLLKDNPNIGPVELNTATFEYEEQVTDRVFKEWEGYRDRAIESMKQKSSWFGKGVPDKKEAPKEENKAQSWQDLWK